VVLLSHVIGNPEAKNIDLKYSSTSRQATSLVSEANHAYRPLYLSVKHNLEAFRSKDIINLSIL